jgi:hypothetical protein
LVADTGDFNVRISGTIANYSVGPMQFCGTNVTSWRMHSGQDMHSHAINAGYTAQDIVALAKHTLYKQN